MTRAASHAPTGFGFASTKVEKRGARAATLALLPLFLSACYPWTPPALSPVTLPAGPARGSVAAPVRQSALRTPVTIVVSVDGLGVNRLGTGLTPRLDALAAAGVSGSMRPSFPTTTFANHVTLATGVRPARHGIVDQRMRDPARPGVTFRNSDPLTNRDPFWWSAVEPIWLDAEQAGIRTGIMYWVGSDVAIRGRRPTLWWPFDTNITPTQRVDTVLDWLRRPNGRPQFLMLYFDAVDRAGHNQGYGSPEELAAITDTDAQIGRLIDGLRELGQPANLLVVSDHGMAAVPAEHIRPLSDLIDPAIMEAISEGPLIDIYPKPGQDAAVAARLKTPPPHLTCWARQDIPARFRYSGNPRIAPFMCMADVGWSYPEKPTGRAKGEHGYDPDAPEVASMFIADGPAFRGGRRMPRFDNVDFYPLLRTLLGLPPKPGVDGDMRPYRGILAEPAR